MTEYEDRRVLGLLALRAAAGKSMPELYREATTSADPLLALCLSERTAQEWKAFAEAITSRAIIAQAKDEVERWAGQRINTVPIGSPEYPTALLKIFDPPPVLFVKGTISPLTFCFAIVGSRSADSIAFSAARLVAREISRSGGTVISGLASGADTAAHRGSLEGGGRLPTIAILGTGLDRIYPASNRGLAEDIVAKGGGLISQFEPDSAVYPSNFIARNRIIAGLSTGILVVQAGKKSGSLATARFALEEGRDVFVTPGQFGDVRYDGSHQLLRDGAFLVTEPNDIIGSYPELEVQKNEAQQAKEAESPLLAAIAEHGTCSVETLAQSLKITLIEAEGQLLELELAGAIQRLPGNMIRPGHLNNS